ncbi:MAG: hypothetical protein WCG36_07675 [bacterium]
MGIRANTQDVNGRGHVRAGDEIGLVNAKGDERDAGAICGQFEPVSDPLGFFPPIGDELLNVAVLGLVEAPDGRGSESGDSFWQTDADIDQRPRDQSAMIEKRQWNSHGVYCGKDDTALVGFPAVIKDGLEITGQSATAGKEISKPMGQAALMGDNLAGESEIVGNGGSSVLQMIHAVKKVAGTGIIKFTLQHGPAQGCLPEKVEDVIHGRSR